MIDATAIREHMPVIGSDRQHVGTVDAMDGNRIKLTRTDPSAGGHHHYLPLSAVAAVADGEVRLNVPAQQAASAWQSDTVAGTAALARGPDDSAGALGAARDREAGSSIAEIGASQGTNVGTSLDR